MSIYDPRDAKVAGPGFALTDEPWMARRNCAGSDPALWFATRGESPSYAREAALAKEICAECPVATACLEYAMRVEGTEHFDLRFGIYGGTTPRQRWERRREMDGKPIPPRPSDRHRPCGTPAAYRRHLSNDEDPCTECKAANNHQTNRKSNADRYAEVVELEALGYSRPEVAQRLGISRAAVDKVVERWRRAQGIPPLQAQPRRDLRHPRRLRPPPPPRGNHLRPLP